MHAALYDHPPMTFQRKAAILEGLINMRTTGVIDQAQFADALRDLGIDPAKRVELLRAARKRDEITHEYETCPDCNCVDGTHSGDCLAVN